MIRPVVWSVAGKHQCRALAESMFSPNEGLREIGRQLSTDVTQELLQYCSGLGEGEACCVFTPSIVVQHGRVKVNLCGLQMATWTLCWITLLRTPASRLLHPEIVPKTQTRIVVKMRQAPKSPPVSKTPVQVRSARLAG